MSEKASTKIARHYRKVKQIRRHNPIMPFFIHPHTKEKIENSISIPVSLLEELLKEKHI